DKEHVTEDSYPEETETEDSSTPSTPAELQAQIDSAIAVGAPVYNSGDPSGCYEIYAATARMIVKTFDGGLPAKKCLRQALDRCLQLDDPDKKAWTMRRAFDAILAGDV